MIVLCEYKFIKEDMELPYTVKSTPHHRHRKTGDFNKITKGDNDTHFTINSSILKSTL